jgi:hypothetical protein
MQKIVSFLFTTKQRSKTGKLIAHMRDFYISSEKNIRTSLKQAIQRLQK